MGCEFDDVLMRLEADSESHYEKGKLFETIIRRALEVAHIYRDQFERVQTYAQWARERGESEQDTGIDLVAQLDNDRYAAIQCKFYHRNARLELDQIDRFIAASARPVFAERYFFWTGGEATNHAQNRMGQVQPKCILIGRDTLSAWDLNWQELYEDPEAKSRIKGKPHQPREDQAEAIDHCLAGFAKHDRGRLILPCGTGKTVTSLWLAEKQVGEGGSVLYLVPSIALVSQSMREWSRHRSLRHRYLAVCSDRSVGKLDEDRSIYELAIPPTTQSQEIVHELRERKPHLMTVVFSTYQSLERLADAQAAGAPAFDLVICDEAHRTTGVESEDGTNTPFTLVHDEERILAKKRLYTTATPRVYTPASVARAAEKERTLFSMDDEGIYGPEFHRLTFGEAISKELLSDYRVSILCINSTRTSVSLRNILPGIADNQLDDVVRLIGCWDALADPEGNVRTRQTSGSIGENPCTTALAFANTIKNSENFAAGWGEYIPQYRAWQEEQFRVSSEGLLEAEVRHVDGTHSALRRHERLNWLDEISQKHQYSERGNLKARILSNARCLTEGVDVPALDAILFIAPRRSQIDIVQAVGARHAQGAV